MATGVHIRGEEQNLVQGPGSQILKYSPSLCMKCNSTVSQPFDVAYDRFVAWIFENESRVLDKRFINFVDVYGPEFEADQRNLYKYFAKSFGCRLVDGGQTVLPDVVALIDQMHFQTALRINFSVNEDILRMPLEDRSGFIGKSGMVAWLDAKDRERVNGYTTNEYVSWFTTNYWYALAPDGDLGSTWVADSQHIYLGSHAPLSPDERAEFIDKVRTLGRDAT